METFSFGKVSHVMILGGGQNLELCFELLKKSGKKITVITSERQKGTFSRDIPHVVSADVNTDKKVLDAITRDTLGVSVGAAWILKKPFIARFKGRLINLHGAELPKDRGAGGFSWRILRGEQRGCALIHQIDSGVDTGPILMQEKFKFSASCRAPRDFEKVLMKHYRPLLRRFFDDIERGKKFTLTAQDGQKATYWPRLATDRHGFIDWRWGAKDIERFICAFDEPYRGASTYLGDKRVFLKQCSLDTKEGPFHPFQTGLVFRIIRGALFVAAAGGALKIKSVTGEDSKNCMGEVRLGDRFHTPGKLLEEAQEFRAVYTPKGLRGSE